jgi:hypothetical protein
LKHILDLNLDVPTFLFKVIFIFYRPMRKSKHQQPESVPSMPVVPSAQTFNLDIPENKSTMTTWNRTFIPMQLRTQPSNLPPSQLQRMNTTLGEQAKGLLA